MRAIVAVLSLILTVLTFNFTSAHADPLFDTGSLFGFHLNMDQHRRYEMRYNASVAALQEHFQLGESSRVLVSFEHNDEGPRAYVVEVKFCLKRNPRVCLSDTLSRQFKSAIERRETKHEFNLHSLAAETLKSMANLARNDELVMVTNVVAVSRSFWPDELLGQHIVNFNHLLKQQSLEAVVPTERYVMVKMRFEPTREL